MRFRYYYILLAMMLMGMTCACSNDGDAVDDIVVPSTEERPIVALSVNVAMGQALKVAYTPDNGGLKLNWKENERLGVYIQKTDGSVIRAGYMTSTGEAGAGGTRHFTGSAMMLESGEKYLYMHPDLNERTSIDFTHQTGALSNTDHLDDLVPLIWTGTGNPEETLLGENRGYIVHVRLQFKENPGQIRKVTLKTMEQGFVDRIFQGGFSLTQPMNSVGTIELTINEGEAVYNEELNLWEADAYLVTAHSEANVYRSKYHVEVLTADNVKYNMCQYVSFPGQQEAAGNTLPMLQNGKMYNFTAQLGEPGICNTIINTNYKVNSMLGMWDNFGKPYDPCQLIYHTDNYSLPSHVYDLVVTNRTALMDRMLQGKSSQGTPTFTSQFGTTGSINNITIQNEPTEVYVTFLSEFAWSQNLLGYYHYETAPAQPSAQIKNILFANMSRGGHVPFNKDGIAGGYWINPNDAQNPGQNIGKVADGPLQEFTTVKLIYTDENGFTSSKFPVGTTIGFFMMQDPKASGIQYDEEGNIKPGTYSPRNDGTLLNWQSARYFTDRAWNTNSVPVFVSGDFARNGIHQQGIAIYGARDNITNTANYAYSAMLFMVSTEHPASMKTTNTKALNLGTGSQVINISNP